MSPRLVKVLLSAKVPDVKTRKRAHQSQLAEVDDIVAQFIDTCSPFENKPQVFTDLKTQARYCECHLRASTIISLGTIDVPLDPDEQLQYRANRDLVEDHVPFERMKADALEHRTFSNIVAEFTTSWDSKHPLKIIGGQHRFEAIKEALEKDVDELHGLKVYFALNTEQRVDVQEISNTNIAASFDLYDRIHETLAGPELRDWCQRCGLLEAGKDFASKRQRGQPITVRAARGFLLNYFRGARVAHDKFHESDTTPILGKTGEPDTDWKALRKRSSIWKDQQLEEAGKEFARLVAAQRKAFAGKKANVDYAEKALNMAVMSAWAYVAGILRKNDTRLRRHYALADGVGKDPLNAAALADGKHKSDSATYRGLGYRTDTKERGRFVELFWLQAEKGQGITPNAIDVAIKRYHAKQAGLEARQAEAKQAEGQDG